MSYFVMHDGSSLNIMLINIIKKLKLSITRPFFYMINILDQSQDTSLEQISGYKMITSSKKYSFTFHIIYMNPSKNSYSLLLYRS